MTLLLLLPLLLGRRRELRCGFGFAAQALAFRSLALFTLSRFRLQAEPFFFARELGRGFCLAEEPLPLCSLFGFATLLQHLQPFELRLPCTLRGGARFLAQAFTLCGLGSFAAPAFFVEPLALELACALRSGLRFLDQPLPLRRFFGLPPEALFFEPLTLGFVRTLRRGFSFAQQALALGGALGFDAALFFLETKALLFACALGRERRLTRGTLCRGSLLDLATAACFRLATDFGLGGAALGLFGLTSESRLLGLRFVLQARLFFLSFAAEALARGLGSEPLFLRYATETRLFFFGLAAKPRFVLCRHFRGLASHALAFFFRCAKLRFLFGGAPLRLFEFSRESCLLGFGCSAELFLCGLRARKLRLDAVGFHRLRLRLRVSRTPHGRGLRFAADLFRAREVSAHFLGKHRWIAAGNRFRFLLAAKASEQPAARRLWLERLRREHRDAMRLDVVDVLERAEVCDQLLLVARREQRGQQDDVGDAR